MEEKTGGSGREQDLAKSDVDMEADLAEERELLLAKLAGRFASRFYDLIKAAQNLDLKASDPEPVITQFCQENQISRTEFFAMQWVDLPKLSPPPLI